MSRHICRSIGRRTLINKGYSKEIAIIYTLRAWAAIACRRVTTYRPYASPMHTHVFVALSRDPSIFLPREHDAYVFRAFRALLLRNQSTAARPPCLSSSFSPACGFLRDAKETPSRWSSKVSLNFHCLPLEVSMFLFNRPLFIFHSDAFRSAYEIIPAIYRSRINNFSRLYPETRTDKVSTSAAHRELRKFNGKRNCVALCLTETQRSEATAAALIRVR